MDDEMMIQIAMDLHKAMPRVMKQHHFKEMWAYKYESSSNENEERTGILDSCITQSLVIISTFAY